MALDQASAKRIAAGIAADRRRLFAVGRFIQAHPEPGHAEVQAAARATAYLRSLGFVVTQPYGGMATAFRAVLKGRRPGPTLAVLAEYDALKGSGHACGHHLIATAALTAAAGMAGLARRFRGQFEVIGTPAEESYAGKGQMIGRGAFRHLDAAFMVHPSSRNRIGIGSNANRNFTARFIGRSAHAAAAPQDGINALDAALLFFNGANALRQHLREDARLHGIITHGGEASNVIPAHAEIEYGVRSLDEDYLEKLARRIEQCCRAAAKAVGARVRIHWWPHWYRAFKANAPLDDLLVATLGAAGIRLHRGTGREARGSLDMGNVSQELPAAHPYFSIVPPGQPAAALHTREFHHYAAQPYAYRQALKAGTGMALAALTLLTDRAVLARVQRAFRTG